MTTKPYSSLLAQVEALAGATLATQEQARVKIFANRRAKDAHRECPYWPRFMRVGEERIVSSTGLLPLAQTGLETIDQIIRIHATDPFKATAANEYTEYYHDSTGIQITGYQATESANIEVSASTPGSPVPNPSGFYHLESGTGQAAVYVLNGNNDALTYPYGVIAYVDQWELQYSLDGGTSGAWAGSGDVESPPLALEWAATSGSGVPVFMFPYSAYITYLAAPADTYGDGSGEEPNVPEEWFEYMAQGAYCDWLRSDGQTEKALAEEAIAAKLLNQQLEKVSRQNGNQVITRNLNHANMQRR